MSLFLTLISGLSWSKDKIVIDKQVLKEHQKLYLPKLIETPVGSKTVMGSTYYGQGPDPNFFKRNYYDEDISRIYQIEIPILPHWPYFGRIKYYWGQPPDLRKLLGW